MVATRGMMMRVFFLAGASVGFIGTGAGFALGLLFALNIETIRQWIQGFTGTELFAAEIYFLSKLPAVVDPKEVAVVVLMGFGLSFLATLYPSWRAARLDPAEALRDQRPAAVVEARSSTALQASFAAQAAAHAAASEKDAGAREVAAARPATLHFKLK